MADIRYLVGKATVLVGEVSGSGVAAYSEDLMFDNAVRAFNMLFTKYNWDEFSHWSQFTLDGITGFAPDGTFDNVRNFEDFINFYKGSNDNPIPIMPSNRNPYSMVGTQLQYWSSLASSNTNFDKKRIQFWPITNTSTVTAHVKAYPVDPTVGWDWGDDMVLDPDMIIHGIAYVTLATDETSAGAADLQRGLMDQRFGDIMAKLADRPITTRRGHI